MKETLGKEFYESADKAITISRPETLEEFAHKMLDDYGIKSMGESIGVLEVKKLMVKMAKWQQEKSYSEEEMIRFASLYTNININESHLQYFNNLPKIKNK